MHRCTSHVCLTFSVRNLLHISTGIARIDVCWRRTWLAWKLAGSRLESELCNGMGWQIKKTKTMKDQFDLTYMRKMARNCGEASKNLLSRCLDTLSFRTSLLLHQLCVFNSELILRGLFNPNHTISDCTVRVSTIFDEQRGWSGRTSFSTLIRFGACCF